MKISVIVLNYNSRDYLVNCLESVLKTEYGDFQVVVIDNGSTDESLVSAKKSFVINEKVRFFSTGRNLGFSKGNNFGASKAIGEILVFLNPDTVVEKGWLEPLIAEFERDEKVGICQPLLLFMDKKRINSTGGVTNFLGFSLNRDYGKNLGEAALKKEGVFYACGAALVIRKGLSVKLGGFDEDFFLYNEDVDLCWRARLLGYKVMFVPKSVVYHVVGGSGGTGKSSWIAYNKAKNHLSMLIKNLSLVSLIWKLPLVYLAYICMAFYCLAKRRIGKGFAYVKAMVWGIINFPKIFAGKRQKVQGARVVPDFSLRRMFHKNLFSFWILGRSQV